MEFYHNYPEDCYIIPDNTDTTFRALLIDVYIPILDIYNRPDRRSSYIFTYIYIFK